MTARKTPTATLRAVHVELVCPHCGEAQDSGDQGLNWTRDDLVDVAKCGTACCDCCGQRFVLPKPTAKVAFEGAC